MNWTLTVVNQDLKWYRVIGDDPDHLEAEKKRAMHMGFDWFVQYENETSDGETLN